MAPTFDALWISALGSGTVRWIHAPPKLTIPYRFILRSPDSRLAPPRRLARTAPMIRASSDIPASRFFGGGRSVDARVRDLVTEDLLHGTDLQIGGTVIVPVCIYENFSDANHLPGFTSLVRHEETRLACRARVARSADGRHSRRHRQCAVAGATGQAGSGGNLELRLENRRALLPRPVRQPEPPMLRPLRKVTCLFLSIFVPDEILFSFCSRFRKVLCQQT